jgi:hypothetical protein
MPETPPFRVLNEAKRLGLRYRSDYFGSHLGALAALWDDWVGPARMRYRSGVAGEFWVPGESPRFCPM